MTTTNYEQVAKHADRAATEADARAVQARRMTTEAEEQLQRARTDAAFAQAEGDGRREKEAREHVRRLEKEIAELRAAIAADDDEVRVQGIVAAEARQRVTVERRQQAEALRPAYLAEQRNVIELADRLLAALRRQFRWRGEMEDLGVNPENVVGGMAGGPGLRHGLERISEEAGKGEIDGAGLSFRLRDKLGWVLKGGECDRE